MARCVVLVSHYYPAHGGGIELVAEQLASRLAGNGRCQIEWFASDVDPAPSHAGLSVRPQSACNALERRFGVPFPLWSPGSILRLATAVRVCDVVHVHDAVYLPTFAAALLAKVLRKRLIVTQHVGYVPFKNALLRGLLGTANRIAGRLILRSADAVVFVSSTVRSYYASLVGESPRWVHIANGVDIDQFTPGTSDERSAARRELRLPATVPLLIFVGRRVEKKGLEILRALAAREPAWHWCIIGDGPIDPGSWGLTNVTVVGRLSRAQLVRYYRAADLLVLPSVGEGFPLVVQEAMSCGLPVAVNTETRDAGELPPEVCVAETVGQPDTTGRWLDGIATFLSLSPQTREERRNACRRIAIERWSWSVAVERYASLLRIA